MRVAPLHLVVVEANHQAGAPGQLMIAAWLCLRSGITYAGVKGYSDEVLSVHGGSWVCPVRPTLTSK